MKKIFYLCFMLTLYFFNTYENKAVNAAVLMGADINDGYADNVLHEIAKHWEPPNDNIQRNVRIQIKIDGKGKLIKCRVLSSADATQMDIAICKVVRSIGEYGSPPYAMPVDVFLSVKTGFSKAAQAGNTGSVPSKLAPSASNYTLPRIAIAGAGDSSANTPQKRRENATLSDGKWKDLEKPSAEVAVLPKKGLEMSNVEKNSPAPMAENKTRRGGALTDGVWTENVILQEDLAVEVQTIPEKSMSGNSRGGSGGLMVATLPSQRGLSSDAGVKNSGVMHKKPVPPNTKFTPVAAVAASGKPEEVESRQLKDETVTPDAAKLYTQSVMKKIAPHIRLPENVAKGKYIIKMSLDVNAMGNVGQINVNKIAGVQNIENTIIAAVKKIGDMPMPPDNKSHKLNLTFIIEKK